MADKISDVEDRLLEALFHAAPIADDGFSVQVVSKIKRRIWFRRLAVPVAAVIGGIIAIRPAAELISILLQLFNFVPAEIVTAPLSFLPQFQLIVLGGMLLAVALSLTRFIEET
jgi:hypothetical protein